MIEQKAKMMRRSFFCIDSHTAGVAAFNEELRQLSANRFRLLTSSSWVRTASPPL